MVHIKKKKILKKHNIIQTNQPTSNGKLRMLTRALSGGHGQELHASSKQTR